MLMGIKINIISDPINISHFKKIVGDGKDYGIEIEYLLQNLQMVLLSH